MFLMNKQIPWDDRSIRWNRTYNRVWCSNLKGGLDCGPMTPSSARLSSRCRDGWTSSALCG
jgi:hypothetical protein